VGNTHTYIQLLCSTWLYKEYKSECSNNSTKSLRARELGSKKSYGISLPTFDMAQITLCNVIRDCDEIQDCVVIQVKGYVKISVLTLILLSHVTLGSLCWPTKVNIQRSPRRQVARILMQHYLELEW